jgi:hypothetical protein
MQSPARMFAEISTTPGRMARPREFDEQVVLDAALVQFWSHGFEATSTRDLAQSMGITSARLYNAFWGKRSRIDHIEPTTFMNIPCCLKLRSVRSSEKLVKL